MRAGLLPALAGTLAVMLLGSLAAAQNQPPSPPPPEQAVAPLTPEQLDRLTAPIALYPDPLVAQILMAATYPLEVVEANRWLQQPGNAALKGDPLAAALAQLPWDPSIKSLVAFPQILGMMDKYLTWTEELGDAFLAGQAALMDSVQRLRQKAEATGGLTSTPEEAVSNDGGAIVIEPANPDVVYVPVYDPNVAYGPWPYPDYPPYYFPDFFPAAAIGPLGFGWIEVVIVTPLWRWNRCDWRRHRIDIDANRFNALNIHHPTITSGAWQHDPAHRRGVPYRDPAVRARFQAAATAERHQAFRAFPAVAPAPLTRPTVDVARPPAAIPGMAPTPRMERGSAATVARPPVVLRGASPVSRLFGRVPEVPAAGQRGQASRMSLSAPGAAAPVPGAAVPLPGVAVPLPRAAAPAAKIAPAPRVAPAPLGGDGHGRD